MPRWLLVVLPIMFGMLVYSETMSPWYIETTDGDAYWYASRTFLEGRGFRNFDSHHPRADKLWAIGDPDALLTVWPPITALALSVFSDKQTGNAVLNMASLMVTMIASALLVYRETRRISMALAVQVAIGAYAYTITPVYRADLSEPLFTSLLVTALLLARHIRTPAAFVASAFILALLPLTRYAALPIIPVFALWVGIQRRRILDVILFLLPVGATLIWWCTRNLLATGTMFGIRPPSDQTVLGITESLSATLVSWSGGLLLVFSVGLLVTVWQFSRWRRPLFTQRSRRLPR